MKRYTGFLSILLLVCLNAFGQQSYIKGVIRDLQLKPLHLASIYVVERDLTYYTQNDGSFAIPVWPNQQQLQFVVSMVDKKAQVIIVKKADYAKVLQIQLKDLSYTLEDVRINPVQKTTVHSNSSIVFDEEAIERVQAFSLMDVLKTLPGKASTAPNLDAPQTLTLRGALGGNYDLNNSLGIPIIMDGVTLSNDANMQARSVSQFGMSGSILSGAKNYSGGDVPFQGIDLRDIPVETIEQIEVIQGVASARFGELTDGAILIQRKAGKTPFSFTTNIHAGSSNYSLSKGFALPSKAGALNLSTNYALSNPDPRDRVKAYSRVGGNVMWSYTLGSGFRNTLSIDGHKRLDEVKMDPDDDTQQMSRTKNAGFSISNRSQWLTSLPWLSTLQWTLAYSQSSQDSYKQWLLNQTPKGYAFKDTTGIYEGVLLSGRYIAEEQILGKPITASSQINAQARLWLGNAWHALSYGISFNYSNNGGKGIIADPDRPRWVNTAGQNARPYSFQYLDPLMNYGFYLSDQFTSNLLGKKIHSNWGIRVDQQNGSWSWQPRLSSTVQINEPFTWSFAFGIASKSPTMAHRYPAPTFLDIPLILAYNSMDALYLVYTEKMTPDNSALKPSKSYQAETSLRFSHSKFNTSFTFFWKANKNGFGSQKSFKAITVPEYRYHFDTLQQKILYQALDQTITYHSYGDYRLENLQHAHSLGVDWMLSTQKWTLLQSSLTFSTSFIQSTEDPSHLEMVNLTTPIHINGESIWYLMYQPRSKNTRSSFMSKIATHTHVAPLGFVVTNQVDVFWGRWTQSRYGTQSQQAVGYLDANGVYHDFTGVEGTLPVRDLSFENARQPFVYACWNLSVAKEIKKKFRIAVTAYNVLNLQPEHLIYSNTNTQEFTVVQYNAPVSITGGITYKF